MQDSAIGSSGFVYVLMSHTDPQAVLATVNRVRQLSPTAHVLVRHSQPDFLPVHESEGIGVLRSDIGIRWGTWSVVAAGLEALRVARDRWNPEFTVLVSGQDHPVRDLAAWEQHVRGLGADAVLRRDPRTYDERWQRCWHELSPGRFLPSGAVNLLGRVGRPFARLLPEVHLAGGSTPMIVHPRRPGGRPPLPYRKGSFWSTLGARAVTALLTTPPEVEAFFRTTLLPDESFAHSVLHADPRIRIADGPTSAAFFPEHDVAHARAVDLGDLSAVQISGAPFTRKVSPGVSDDFVRAIDARVDARRASTAEVPRA